MRLRAIGQVRTEVTFDHVNQMVRIWCFNVPDAVLHDIDQEVRQLNREGWHAQIKTFTGSAVSGLCESLCIEVWTDSVGKRKKNRTRLARPKA